MGKPKTPFFSLEAHGTVADTLTAQKRGAGTIMRRKPTPTDRKTLPQIYQRWLYQDYVAWWQTLSGAQKQTWESAARPYHMSGFAYWMKDRLTNLPDLAGMWHLDHSRDGSVIDFSRHANHGIVYGAIPAPGIIDGGFYFDGLDDSIAIPGGLLFGTGDFTLELRIIPAVLDRLQVFLSKATAWNIARWTFRIEPDNTIRFLTNDLSTKYADSTTLAIIGTPLYLAAVRQGNKIRLLVNGSQENPDTTLIPDQSFSGTYPCRIGRTAYSEGEWYKGIVDHFVPHSRALSNIEIFKKKDRRFP